ncbi:MAG: RNA 2'-phosphotransferase [Candidatus Methanomethylophilaceae archaeon]|jgi:putative RNA 2'-phosphotransferase|nr:2'-phosphotransferase [Methanomassiliicoccales archaeon RumEn M2]MDD2531923.1 RNA 2'-phosphotransferase [Candidatus Methanomethylophilaceae archaeon]MDI9378790.1 RNA 2'-phosphotransferase [Candidatus Thermoplasmatota archaeon]MDD2779373.1 RNA 2'-phosphotransferase [Candidatus Methanomethylophilaceae archaeon]MDD3127857.1 RNA 2'-phosphotransferase [Candidatus Methanomethylophilaceae archaeon]
MRECEDHGYFREDQCPVCGEEGKFIMNDFETERLGRSLAGILRHGRFDLSMDDQGFVDMRDIVGVIKEKNPRMHWLRPHHIVALVDTDPKGRYQVSGNVVRATYGHTIELDMVLNTENVPDYLYYPTAPEETDLILESGLYPSDRAMVHLSLTYQDAFNAGSVRVEQPVILEIDVNACFDAGYDIGKAAKTVFLCKHVPPECLSIIYEEETE